MQKVMNEQTLKITSLTKKDEIHPSETVSSQIEQKIRIIREISFERDEIIEKLESAENYIIFLRNENQQLNEDISLMKQKFLEQ